MQVSLVYDLQASLVFLHVGLVQCSSYSVQIGYRTSVQTLEFRRLVYKWCEISSIYVFVFMKNGEVDSEWGAEKKLVLAVCFRETGKWKLSKSWSDKTNKRLTQRRENFLMLIDVSSLCICYYFRCPRTSPKAKSSSSHNNAGCDNALLCGANVIFRMGAGCLHSTGELLWGTLKPSSITFSFSFHSLTGAGSVGQSSWRLIPCLQLWQQ